MCEYELYHHGVKGMKWGVRKARTKETELGRKKAAYKKAKKEYNKSFNKAYNRAIGAYSPFKKHRENNDKRWADAAKKGEKLNKAKSEYKTAKKEFNKNTTVGQKIGATFRTDSAKTANKLAIKATKAAIKVSRWSLTDDLFFGGAGKEAVKATGRAATTAVLMAMGHHDIKWYDKYGRRVG